MPTNEKGTTKDSGETMAQDGRTLEELQDEARRAGIPESGAMNKSDLIKALQTHNQSV